MNDDGDISNNDFAAAMLLEKIVRDAYPSTVSSEIQPLQWSILRYVAQSPEHRCTMSWIKRFLGLTHAPVVRAINTLVQKGFLAQIPNPEDARSNILVLTPSGRKILDADPLLSIVERIQTLSNDDRSQFRKYVRSLAINPNARTNDT